MSMRILKFYGYSDDTFGEYDVKGEMQVGQDDKREARIIQEQ